MGRLLCFLQLAQIVGIQIFLGIENHFVKELLGILAAAGDQGRNLGGGLNQRDMQPMKMCRMVSMHIFTVPRSMSA